MTNDAEWVEDVRRWCYAGGAPGGGAQEPLTRPNRTDLMALGYEAAHPGPAGPAHWPERTRHRLRRRALTFLVAHPVRGAP